MCIYVLYSVSMLCKLAQTECVWLNLVTLDTSPVGPAEETEQINEKLTKTNSIPQKDLLKLAQEHLQVQGLVRFPITYYQLRVSVQTLKRSSQLSDAKHMESKKKKNPALGRNTKDCISWTAAKVSASLRTSV